MDIFEKSNERSPDIFTDEILNLVKSDLFCGTMNDLCVNVVLCPVESTFYGACKKVEIKSNLCVNQKECCFNQC